MSWFFEYRCNRSLKNHLCRLQYWIFDFAAYMQHYAKNTVSALNHSIILFILWKFVRLCIFGCLIQPEQVSLKKKFLHAEMQYFYSILWFYSIWYCLHQMRRKFGERGIFACQMQPEGVIFSKNARLAVNTVFLQYFDFLFSIRCFVL